MSQPGKRVTNHATATRKHTPDLIDDDKVLAVSLVEHPIGLIDPESEGSERRLTQRRGRLGDLWALFFRQPLQMRQELAMAKKCAVSRKVHLPSKEIGHTLRSHRRADRLHK